MSRAELKIVLVLVVALSVGSLIGSGLALYAQPGKIAVTLETLR